MNGEAAKPESPPVVLIVDDNPNNLALLGRVLEGGGYRVRGAADGVSALRVAQSRAPDLILLDLQMPGIDGYEVCRRIKALPALASIPVLVISALDDTGDKLKAFEAGAVDYVTKPFSAPEVLARVGSHLQIDRLRRELERKNAELVAAIRELKEANQRTRQVFSALSDVLPGHVLDGKYRLDEKIGEGAYAAVFRGQHLQLNRPVAVKVFRPLPGNDSPEAFERFRREGMSASSLDHRNVVAVHDCGASESGIAYIVMELLSGLTLEQLMRRNGALKIERSAAILAPVCLALAAAHEAGIVHRDVRPENIFVHESPRGEVVKLLDFGIAKMLADTGAVQLTQGLVGIPAYVAPERLTGAAFDGSADVYSIGVVLYRMLSNRLPFSPQLADETPVMAALRISHEPPAPLAVADIPEEVERFVLKALAKDPAVRPSARLMAEGLGLLR